MTDGRTFWWAKDSGWWRREMIVELGEEFGAAGPAVIDWLSCEAKAQNCGGWVKSGPRAVARGCFVEIVTVRDVLLRAVTLGVLDDFGEETGRFSCRISGWQGDQERVAHALRQARYRDKQRDSAAEVTVGDGPRRSVTNTEQNRTEDLTSSLRSDVAECFAYWQERCGHKQAKLTRDRSQKITARLREGYSVLQIRDAIDGAAKGAFVNEAGTRFDDIELICRTGSKLESFIGRDSASVVSLEARRSPALERMDAWKAYYPEEGA